MRYPSNYILTAIESQTFTPVKTITISGNTNVYDIISNISSFKAPTGYTLPDYRLVHLNVLEKKGYTYDGLYTDAGLTTEFSVLSTIGSNMTLYTKWTDIEVPIEDYTGATRIYNSGVGTTNQYDYSNIAFDDDVALYSNQTAASPYYKHGDVAPSVQPSSRVTSVGLGKTRKYVFVNEDEGYAYDDAVLNVFALGLLSSPYFLPVAHFNSTLSAQTYTDISSNVDIFPTGTVYASEFCLAETFLALGHATTPFLTVYKTNSNAIRVSQEDGETGDPFDRWNEDNSKYDTMTFSKLDNPTTLPTGKVMDVAWGGYDQEYLATGHYNSPYLSIYKRSDRTLTKISDPTTLPTAAVISLSMSADGVYLACIQDTSPYLVMYKRSGDVFTKITSPTTTFTNPTSVDLSPSGDMVIADTISVFGYRRSGDTFIQTANLDDGLPGATTFLTTKYSLDGSTIITGINYGPDTYGHINQYW